MKLTKQQKDNLAKLSKYLSKLPKKYNRFNMSTYMTKQTPNDNVYLPINAKEQITKCGTIACALGHGPSAGIKPKDEMSWQEYSALFTKENSPEEEWCFSPWWRYVDNTPHGAAERINYLLNKGLPKDWKDQMYKKVPLSYKE